MLQLSNLGLTLGNKTLFSNINLTIFAKQKIGLIGANGTGKSSLFSLLRGETEPSHGDLHCSDQLRIAHVLQETPALDQSALDYVTDGHHQYAKLNQLIMTAEQNQQYELLAQYHQQMSDLQLYDVPSQAAKLLVGLGFSLEKHQLSVSRFSGGWRMRLNLARALIQPSDLLLLDEPTNHLDLDAIYWLENWLRNYSGTLILISHDREFLDACIDYIFHLDQQTITIYRGNYSTFEKTQAEQLALQQATYEKQQKAIKHMMVFVDRFRYKATKAKQAQSRLKAIEKMDTVTAVQIRSPFHFEFFTPDRTTHPLLNLQQLGFSYDDKTILNHVNLQLAPGSRIGLLGPNGAGKTTLMKLIAGALTPTGGERILSSQHIKLAYYDQHQVDALDLSASPVNHIQRLSPERSELDIRQYLGGFAFSGDTAVEPITHFSGGEKARLALAILVWKKPNLILLDEPTNHLDMDMRNALELALQSYQGALVIVSHDRYLLRTTVDEFFLVAHQQVKPFDGDLDDYQRWLNQQTSSADTQKTKTENNSYLLKQQIEKCERKLQSRQQQLQELEQQLADPDLYADNNNQLTKLQTKHQQLKQDIEDLESEWLMLDSNQTDNQSKT